MAIVKGNCSFTLSAAGLALNCQNTVGYRRVVSRAIEAETDMKISMVVPALVGLLVAAQAAQSGTVKQAAGERGRYEGVVASDNSVWVVDTRTGRVRRCTQEFADQTPKCSDYSR